MSVIFAYFLNGMRQHLVTLGRSWEFVNRRRHFTKVFDWLGWKYAKISTSTARCSFQPVPQGICVCFLIIQYREQIKCL